MRIPPSVIQWVRALMVGFGWLLGGGAPSAAATLIANHVIHTWDTDNGLPQSSVTGILQTQDGYLWVGTYNGLARFDGVRFTIFDNNNVPEIHDAAVTCLFESGDGTLWIGHSSGETTSYRSGRFSNRRNSLRGKAIRGLGSDSQGDVWMLNEDGILERERDGLVLTVKAGTDSGVVTMARSRQGNIWVLRNGQISELVQAKLITIAPPGTTTDTYVEGVGASRDDGLWVVLAGRLYKLTGKNWSASLGPAPSNFATIEQMIETTDGSLAESTTDQGFYLFRPGEAGKVFHFDRSNGLISDWVRAVCEDREGSMWVGSGSSGLCQIRATTLQIFSPPDHWQGRAVSSVTAGRDGSLWVATEGVGLYRFHMGTWKNFGTNAGLENLFVWSVLEDSAGSLWAGTWGGGLLRWRGSQFQPTPGLEAESQYIQSLCGSRQGCLWIGTRAGLLRYAAGKVTRCSSNTNSESTYVSAIVEDPANAVWFGTSGSGLGCWNERSGELRRFGKADGLSGDYVTCLHLDQHGALWIGTAGAGLNLLNQGHFTVVNHQQGLPNDYICSIEEDDRGNFWMGSHGGIIRARRSDLEQCAVGKTNKIQCLTFGLSDGLPTLECLGGRQPTSCKTTDGRLWFSTTKTVVSVDPGNVRLNLLPPPVAIESVLVDDQAVVQRAGSLVVPPGLHHLEFDYTALSFVAPEKVLFKYRLAGLMNDWEEAGTRRSANYSYVPPGHYQFQVMACNNDGIWNQTGAESDLEVQPYFYQTPWFRLLGGTSTAFLAGGTVWLGMRQRMRRKLKQLEQQRALDRERSRIAQDIHDDLGASLTLISLLAESVRSGPPNQPPSVLNRIYETSRELTRTMDEIVWAVNPRHDTLESLASYLSKFAQDYVRAASIRCSFDVPTSLPARPLAAELRHNIFLAFKEALHNVIKHAAASEVQIRLTLHDDFFTIVISDNGCGFNPHVSTGATRSPDRIEGGQGLVNIPRRLAEIGGRCVIQSAPGAGTRVNFDIPLKRDRRLPARIVLR
jgi:ligand-binding sensor domain-containing protein/signal transduction histidine kinase